MSRSVWTPELEAKVHRLKAEGKKNPEIAEALGMKLPTVINYCWRQGIGGGTPRRDGWLQRGGPAPVQSKRVDPEIFAKPSLRRFSWEADA